MNKAITKSGNREIRISKSIILLLGVLASIGVCYLIVTFQRNESKKKLDNSLLKAFKGKTEVSDYKYDFMTGNLVSTSNLNQGFTLPLFHDLKEKENLDKILDYYFLKKGGYSYLIVKKYDNRIKYTEIKLTDMGFTSQDENRDVTQAYEQMINFLKDREHKQSFTLESYNSIELSNLIPILNQSPFFNGNSDIEGGIKPSGKIYPNWDVLFDNYFMSNDKIFFYTKYTMNIDINENKKFFYKRWGIYSAIFVAVIFLTYFLIKYRPKISIT